MAQTLFAVSFLIGDGGDGCPSSGMNRITADARRLSDQPRSSPFGWQHRDSGNVTCSYDETGRQNTAPQREIYERVFVRFRKWPSSGSPDPIVWALKGTVEGNPALCLRVSTSGFVTFYNQGGQTAPGEAFGGKGLSLNRWYRFDVYAKFNDLTPSAPNPPYENNAAVIMTIDDVMVVYKNRQGVNPQYGVDLYNQKAAQSRLADSANAGKELEADYADWAASSDGWIAPDRRVTLARPVSAGTYNEWTSGNADYRHQLDYPFVITNIGGVSTQTASARQTYAVESLASLGITGTIVSARVAVYLESVPGGDLLLMVRRNGTDSVFNIGTAPQGAWSTWRVPTSGWSPTDAIEIGVKNASNPLGATTRLGACALLVEHDSAVAALVDREFVILNTSYTGNGTQQSVSLGSLDSDVATLTPSFVIVLPHSGNGAGAWCWDSRVYPSQTNNAGAHWGIVPRPGEVLLAGSSASSNQNGVTYRLIACFDPSQRIVARRAVALAAGSGTRDVDLAADFEPAAVFVAREQAYLNDATKIFYRGAGHGSSESVSLGVDVSAVSGAVDGWTSGEVTVGTLIKEVTQDYALSAWRTGPFRGPRLVAVTSYTGNGTNPRNIALALDGGTPLLALVVPTNAGARWLRFGSIVRQFGGVTTGSADAITALGSDSLTVGSQLNTNAVTYSVFALVAGKDNAQPVQSVEFGTVEADSGWRLTQDNGTIYGTPEWNALGAAYPYLVRAGRTLRVKRVEVHILNPPPGVTYRIRGTGPGGISFPSTTASLVSGETDLFEATNLDGSTAFASNLTAFYDPFEIQWEVSGDGGTSWQWAGASKNPIYVCLSSSGATGPGAVTLYHAVVHLACSNAGATDVDEAVAKTWALFVDREVTTWDGHTLYYYKFGTDFAENDISVSALLANKTGQCLSWAHLLQNAWTVNGVIVNANANGASYYTLAAPNIAQNPNGPYFWVKDWSGSQVTGDWFYCQSVDWDMQPVPADGPYGHYDLAGALFKNGMTLPGQNSGVGAPSQKLFSNHQFVKYTNLAGSVLYYDPSYGATYTGPTDFQAQAVQGVGATFEPYPLAGPYTHLRFRFEALGGTTVISFTQ